MQKLHSSGERYVLWAMVGAMLVILPPRSTVSAETPHQTQEASEPVYISMEALHAAGGVPPGWQFTLPAGSPEAGREVFRTMQCYTCHEVAGETFPAYPPREVGPELSSMGAHHPAVYFAESIVNPNAVIVIGEGHTGPDGRSRMPAYNDDLTITQLVDLVAYLKSLRGPSPHGQHGGGHTHRPDAALSHDASGHGAQHHK